MKRRDFVRLAGSVMLLPLINTESEAESCIPDPERAVRNLVIVGWDGAGLDNVRPMLEANLLPNLKAFIDKGAVFIPLNVTERTVTQVSWAAIFTGLGGEYHGVFGNWHHNNPEKIDIDQLDLYTDERGMKNVQFWISQIRNRWTIFHRIQGIGYATCAVTSKPGMLGADTSKAALATVFARTDYHASYHPEPYSPLAIDDYHVRVTDDFLNFAEVHSKFLAFVHYNPDIYGHKFGEPSERYRHEFVRCDEQLGRILGGIDRTVTNVMVITDHGFNPGERIHSHAPDAWMATDLPINPDCSGSALPPTLFDVAPTILNWYGQDHVGPIVIPNTVTIPKLRGRSLL
jgi:arylsulfatase A-like enzyme